LEDAIGGIDFYWPIIDEDFNLGFEKLGLVEICERI